MFSREIAETAETKPAWKSMVWGRIGLNAAFCMPPARDKRPAPDWLCSLLLFDAAAAFLDAHFGIKYTNIHLHSSAICSHFPFSGLMAHLGCLIDSFCF
jgi:hypothetical protein